MAKILMKAQGLNGELILMTDRVVINRPGIFNFLRYGPNAKREIPLSAISEVIFTPPTIFTMGEIELVRSGRSSDDKKSSNSSANSMRFARRKVKEFEMIKEKIFEIMDQIGRR